VDITGKGAETSKSGIKEKKPPYRKDQRVRKKTTTLKGTKKVLTLPKKGLGREEVRGSRKSRGDRFSEKFRTRHHLQGREGETRPP